MIEQHICIMRASLRAELIAHNQNRHRLDRAHWIRNSQDEHPIELARHFREFENLF